MAAQKEDQLFHRKAAHAVIALAAIAVACAVCVVSENPGCATLYLASAVFSVYAASVFSTP